MCNKKGNNGMRKGVAALIVAIVFCVCMFSPTAKPEASAYESTTAPKYLRISVQGSNDLLRIDYPTRGYIIKNISVKKDGKATRDLLYKIIYEEDSYQKNGENYKHIQLYAKKAGTYKFRFESWKSGKKITTNTVTVIASEFGRSPVESITLDGKLIWDGKDGTDINTNNYYTTKKTGIIKIGSPVPGIKIKNTELSYENGKGEFVRKAFKSGKKVGFSTDSYNGAYWIFTQIIITYTDKYSDDPSELKVWNMPYKRYIRVKSTK